MSITFLLTSVFFKRLMNSFNIMSKREKIQEYVLIPKRKLNALEKNLF
jgi:hypothetical protein